MSVVVAALLAQWVACEPVEPRALHTVLMPTAFEFNIDAGAFAVDTVGAPPEVRLFSVESTRLVLVREGWRRDDGGRSTSVYEAGREQLAISRLSSSGALEVKQARVPVPLRPLSQELRQRPAIVVRAASVVMSGTTDDGRDVVITIAPGSTFPDGVRVFAGRVSSPTSAARDARLRERHVTSATVDRLGGLHVLFTWDGDPVEVSQFEPPAKLVADAKPRALERRALSNRTFLCLP